MLVRGDIIQGMFRNSFEEPEPLVSGEQRELIVGGKTNKEIADELFISLQTVKDHVYRIFKKTNVKNRVHLVNLFLRSGDDRSSTKS